MAGDDSGDKTEKPTPKKLEDARKKGDIAKSKDITNTVVLILWVALLGFGVSYAGERLMVLLDAALSAPSKNGDFIHQLSTIGGIAIEALLIISAMFMVPVAVFGTLVDFLQIGPILSFEKIKPKMENLSLASGLKRMFGMDNLVEVIKHILKTSLLFFIAWLVFKAFIPELALLPTSDPTAIGTALQEVTFRLFAWTVGIFSLISVLDAGYQKYSHTKKLRMSMRDIKQEFKDSEGDPMIKQKRREAHQEWSQQGATQAAKDSNVVIVNPTHVAIALDYDRELSPAPTIAAKGEDYVARAMREAAEEEGVPILRNVGLARELLANAQEGDVVPSGLFDIIAEVILWATEVREEIELQKTQPTEPLAERKYTPPGEDLTCYPEDDTKTP
jgi:type III secretion YscU/HrpY family protein